MSRTEKKSGDILEKILELVNAGKKITFQRDFGDNTLTVIVDESHTHVGTPGGTYETMIDGLHASVHNESWMK